MKYIQYVQIGRKPKFRFMDWKIFKWMWPKNIMLRVKTKKGIKFALCPVGEYVETEKLHDVGFVYPWNVITCRMVRLRGKPREGPKVQLLNGKLYVPRSPQINNESLKINYKKRNN